MTLSNYQLKAGVLLQAFGDASKVMTNANITDELAEFHLKTNPSCARYFSIMPGKANVPDDIRGPDRSGPTIIVAAEEVEEAKAEVIPAEVAGVISLEDKIKGELKELGVRFHPKTGIEKLKILLAANTPK